MAIYEGDGPTGGQPYDDTASGDYTLMDGGLGNDVLNTTHNGEVKLLGGFGNDFVFIDYVNNPGAFGILHGGPGDDVVYGGAQKDNINGADGNDYIVAHGLGGILKGNNGSDLIVAGAGARDVVIYGGAGDENPLVTFTVYDQNRQPFTVQAGLYGSPGEDKIYGGGGDDLIVGGDGRDDLHGGAGHDVLIGGLGSDDQLGGPGDDIFRFLSTEDSFGKYRDFISDFDPREHDRMDLSAIDANENLRGDQAFTFIGTHGFDHNPGELRFHNDLLMGDTDGDGHTDFKVKLDVRGPDDPTQHDFVL